MCLHSITAYYPGLNVADKAELLHARDGPLCCPGFHGYLRKKDCMEQAYKYSFILRCIAPAGTEVIIGTQEMGKLYPAIVTPVMILDPALFEPEEGEANE